MSPNKPSEKYWHYSYAMESGLHPIAEDGNRYSSSTISSSTELVTGCLNACWGAARCEREIKNPKQGTAINCKHACMHTCLPCMSPNRIDRRLLYEHEYTLIIPKSICRHMSVSSVPSDSSHQLRTRMTLAPIVQPSCMMTITFPTLFLKIGSAPRVSGI